MKNISLNLKPTLEVVQKKDEIVCTCVFKGEIPEKIKKTLSNPDGKMRYTISFKNTASNKLLINRYKKAVEDGKIYTNPHIKKCGDVIDEGEYIPPFNLLMCDGFVMGKYLDSDLKKLGY